MKLFRLALATLALTALAACSSDITGPSVDTGSASFDQGTYGSGT